VPSHLEASQRLRVVTVAAMCDSISIHANLVEKVEHTRRIVCLNAKTPDEIGLLFPRVTQKT
jgi:hypothetical protein